VNIQLNIVTCPTYPDKFIRNNNCVASAPSVRRYIRLHRLYIIKLTMSYAKRSFSTAAPLTWNSLPPVVLNCDSLSLLSNPDLKLICFLPLSANYSTYLFRQRYINFVLLLLLLLRYIDDFFRELGFFVPSCIDCYTKGEAATCEGQSEDSVWFNGTCYNATAYDNYTYDCFSMPSSLNCTPYNWLRDQISQRTSATEEYFKYVLSLEEKRFTSRPTSMAREPFTVFEQARVRPQKATVAYSTKCRLDILLLHMSKTCCWAHGRHQNF